MSRSRRQRKKKQDRQGVFYIAIAVVILMLIGTSYFYVMNNTHDRNQTTMCRDDGFVASEYAVLIDTTDSFNKTQALMAKKELYAMFEASGLDSRFTLYAIDESSSEKAPILELCNPGDGKDKSELTSNKRRLLKKWEDGFRNKIGFEIEKLLEAKKSDSSPIMETLKFAAVNTFYGSKAESKKLVLLSDLLQHSDSYSHYREAINHLEFTERDLAKAVSAPLEGVEVEVLYLYRNKDAQRQNRAHISFWEAYIAASGGNITRVKRLN